MNGILIPFDQAMVLLDTLQRAYGVSAAKDLIREYESGSSLARHSSLTKRLKVETDRVRSLIELLDEEDEDERDEPRD